MLINADKSNYKMVRFGRYVLFAAAACLLLMSAASDCRAVAVLRHNLDVTLSPGTQELSGTDTMTVRTGGERVLPFLLAPKARVQAVTSGAQEAEFEFDKGRLMVHVPPDVTGDPIRLQVTYSAVFSDRAPVEPLNDEDPGYGFVGSISEDGVFLLPEAGWYPELPGGMPLFLVRVRTPPGFDAITSGKRLDRRFREGLNLSVWETSYPVEGLTLCAGRYIVREAHVGDLPIYTYFYPGNDAFSESYLAAAATYLRFYIELFGPYPFEKFAVVENFFPTGYGFPSFTLLGSEVIRLPFIVKTSLPHEIAHSWWGNSVLVAPDSGNWCEGLTTYVSDYLLKEKESPEKAYEYRLDILRDFATLVDSENDIPLDRFKARFNPALRAVGYGKSAMVFHMLRRLVGDKPFWDGLREMHQSKRFQYVAWNDFTVTFENESGLDLAGFFRQWIQRSGAPFISLEKVQLQRKDGSWVIGGKILQEKPAYDMGVSLAVKTAQKDFEVALDVNRLETPFSIESADAPIKLTVDPDAELFRRLHPSEIPPCVNSVKGSQSLSVVTSSGLTSTVAATYLDVLKALGLSQVRPLGETQTESLYARDSDLLFVGLPKEKQIRAILPEGWEFGSGGFTVDGKTFDDAGDLLFAVFRHPKFERRVVAVLYPLSEQAAVKALNKIPHYGKYGYLVFSNGRNEAKGVWPVSASPLTRTFN
ncbi:MAG: M1 family peptidase [Deltaproteobacteria bacterium]|nr:M1 family peptidase [Deltaproteobacteria bacterium]